MQPEIVVQTGHTLPVTDVCFSPDSRFVATASADETVRIWDLRVGCEFRVLAGHRGPVYSVRYSPLGNCLVTGGYDKQPMVWDPVSGALIRTLETSQLAVSQLEFSHDGRRLMSVSQEFHGKGQVFVWDTADWSLLRSFNLEYGSSQSTQSVALSPDGAKLAVYYQDPARIAFLDVAGGVEESSIRLRQPATRDNPTRSPGDLIYAASGEALICSGDGRSPKLIPLGASNKPKTVKSSLKKIGALSRLPDGSMVLFGEDGFERFNPGVTQCVAKGSGSFRALGPDGVLAANVDRYGPVITDLATGAIVYKFREQPNTRRLVGNLVRQYAVASNPIYPAIAWSTTDGYIRLWDLRSGRGPRIVKGSDGPIENLAFSPDGRLLATASRPIRVWNPWDGTLIAEIKTAKDEAPSHLTFSSTGDYLVVVGFGSLTIIETRTWKFQNSKLALKERPSGVVFEPETDRFYVATRQGEWARFQLGKPKPKVNRHKAPIAAVAINNGNLAVAYSQRKWIEGLMLSVQQNAPAPPPSVVSYLRQATDELMPLTNGSPYVNAAAVRPDGNAVATACGDGEVNVWDPARPDQPRILAAHPGAATSLAWTSDGRFLVTTGMDGALRLWRDSDQTLAATMVSFSDSDYVIAAADGSYTATRGGLAGVVFRVGDRAVPFDQFDLSLNRPDRVHDSLAYAYSDLIDSFQLAHKRRLRRMGVSQPESADGMQLPDLQVLSPPVPLAVAAHEISLRVQAVPNQSPLNRLLVFVNDVPYPNRRGFDLGSSTEPVERDITLPLSTGPNRIEISVLAANGAESLRQVIQTNRPGDVAAGRLLLLALGVSSYREQSLNLRYAAKDARDLADALGKHRKHFASLNARVLNDSDATRSAILQTRAFLESSTVDDQVIIFFSGHGALFGYDYYFLPHDFDPADPTASALHYNTIEGLLDGISARKRLVLLDTCHAGEADFVAPESGGTTADLPSGVKAFRHFGPARQNRPPRSMGVGDPTLAELFADLRRGAGAFVIAAAGAAEYAVEREKFANGVFTYCVLQSLEDSAADLNQDGLLRVSELHRYVSRRVVELTNGRQQPLSRRENLRNDFPVI